MPQKNGKTQARVTRVLVVDDNVDGANSLAWILAQMGHEVSVAHSGQVALDVARLTLPQVLFLDLVMPGIDGYEVARQLRADSTLNGLRIYALSGFGGVGDRQRSRDAGIDQHLNKPLDPEFLESLLGRR